MKFSGTFVTTFYIILKGSCGVLIDQNVPVSAEKLAEEAKNEDPSKKPPATEKIRIEVKILTPGVAFGELALLSRKPRMATIVAKENCHLAVLDKEYFMPILG